MEGVVRSGKLLLGALANWQVNPDIGSFLTVIKLLFSIN